jgi:hypothetical protein
MPSSIAGFRALVEAQDLNTEAGRAAYVALIQLAPAFADLVGAAQDAASAAAIADGQGGCSNPLTSSDCPVNRRTGGDRTAGDSSHHHPGSHSCQ